MKPSHSITTNHAKFANTNPIQQGLIGKFHAAFVRELIALQPRSVCEVGAGEGFLLHQVEQQLPDVPLMGIDLNDEALAQGRVLFPTLHLEHGDIYHIAHPDTSWDVVVCSEVLEHLGRPAEALQELKRVAKRYVLLSVPHEPWFRLGNFARGRHLARLGNHPEHINQWSKNGFARFVAQTLHVEKVLSSFPWTIVVAKV